MSEWRIVFMICLLVDIGLLRLVTMNTSSPGILASASCLDCLMLVARLALSYVVPAHELRWFARRDCDRLVRKETLKKVNRANKY